MSITVTLLGTGSPMPHPDRAGPATRITATSRTEGDGDDVATRHFLVDAGRGVLMRLAAAGLGAGDLAAVFITHLHSDHITDLNDVITLSLIHISEPTRRTIPSRMPSSA